MELNKIYEGNALHLIKTLPDKYIDCVITSSPYWGLRSYGTKLQIWDGDEMCEHDWETKIKKGIGGGINSNKVQIKDKDNFHIVPDSNFSFCSKCGAWLGELGAEPTFHLFIKHLIDIFNEIKRVLKNTGTCFINLGDTYSGSGGWDEFKERWKPNKQLKNKSTNIVYSKNRKESVPNKCLNLIPERFAISMIDNGWIARNQIIWHKPNQMPNSVTDRFTVDFEKIFFFVKQGKYYFEQQLEPYTGPLDRWGGDNLDANGKSTWDEGTGQTAYRNRNMRPNPEGRNMRTVWSVNTEPFPEAHFATYPEILVKRMMESGCPKGGIVLDPFMGAGTTAVVARKLGRKYIGFELNPDYIKIAEQRIYKEIGLFL